MSGKRAKKIRKDAANITATHGESRLRAVTHVGLGQALAGDQRGLYQDLKKLHAMTGIYRVLI